MVPEDMEKRAPARTRYILPNKTLALSQAALETTISLLRRAGQVESCVFWYGPRDPDGNGQVAAVIAPRQVMTRGNYHVSASAMSEMIETIADTTWKPLAQVHSHPGRGVEHSRYDDRMVSSRRALSLVFPYFGQWNEPWPTGVGVHEWQDDYWHLLSHADASRRILIAPNNPIRSKDLR